MTVADYLRAAPKDFVRVPGVEDTLANKIYTNIRVKVNGASLVDVMCASSVFGEGIGSRKLVALLDAVPNLLGLKGDISARIVSVDGFQEITAQKIAEAIPKFKAWLKLHPQIKIGATSPPVSVSTSGVVVFSGFRDDDLEAAAASAGYRVSASVTKDTTLVVAKDPASTSGKVKKGRSLGIDVVDVDTFKRGMPQP